MIVNAAIQAERQQYLKAEPFQHNNERQGYANGSKLRTINTRVRNITFAIPQVREGGFYPEALEKGLRSERALLLALAEMYVQGVSTCKLKAVAEKLSGVAISSTQVNHAAAFLDTDLEKRRTRPLGEYPYLFVDAFFEQVRKEGQVRYLAVLSAVGVNSAKKREILPAPDAGTGGRFRGAGQARGALASLPGEPESSWAGGRAVDYQSDDHTSLRAARSAAFSGIPW